MGNCDGPGATHWFACDHREREWAERFAASEKAREEAERERVGVNVLKCLLVDAEKARDEARERLAKIEKGIRREVDSLVSAALTFEEAHYEDLCEYARAVLDNPDHPHRDDFGGYARETIGGLLKWIERLESRLSISCQRNMSWRAELKSRALAAESRAARLQFQIEREIVFLEEEAATGVSFYEATFTQRAMELRAALAAEEGK